MKNIEEILTGASQGYFQEKTLRIGYSVLKNPTTGAFPVKGRLVRIPETHRVNERADFVLTLFW